MRPEMLVEDGFLKHRKKTRRDQFLEELEQIIPWTELEPVIEPCRKLPLAEVGKLF